MEEGDNSGVGGTGGEGNGNTSEDNEGDNSGSSDNTGSDSGNTGDIESPEVSEEDFDSGINNAVDNVTSRFDFYNDIIKNVEDMSDVITDTTSSPVFYVDVGENKWFSGKVKVVDLSWYEPYRELGDNVICIFAYVSFLWNIFIRLPDIIAGAGASSYAGNQISDIKAYKKTGFGRTFLPNSREK